MELFEKIDLGNGLYATKWHALYHEPTRSVICSDLHLGYERAMVGQGVMFPLGQFEKIIEKFQALFSAFKVESVVLNGDVKHEFGRGSSQQESEVRKLLGFLSGKCEKVHVVKGNHDNYLKEFCKGFERVEFHEKQLTLDGLLITHGAEAVANYSSKTLVMGHQHPSIVLRDEVGAQMKLPCFLHKKGFAITPAMSPLSAGTEALRRSATGFLGRVLESEGIGSFTPIAVSPDGLLGLPKLSRLQRLSGKSLFFEQE